MAAAIASGMTTGGTIQWDMSATPFMAGALCLSVGICQGKQPMFILSNNCALNKTATRLSARQRFRTFVGSAGHHPSGILRGARCLRPTLPDSVGIGALGGDPTPESVRRMLRVAVRSGVGLIDEPADSDPKC